MGENATEVPPSCAGCGRERDPSHTFCPHCGHRYLAVGEVPPTCPICEAVIDPGDRFCRSCGAPLGAAAPVPSPPRAAPAHAPVITPGRAILAAGAALVVLGVALFLALAVSRGWLTRELQVVLAEVGGLALLVAGTLVAGREPLAAGARGRRIGGDILAGAGVGIAQLGLIAGAALYDPPVLGTIPALIGSAIVTSLVVAVAVRSGSQILAGVALGIGLFGPILLDTGATTASLFFVALVLIATAAIGYLRRWPWLTPVAVVTGFAQVGEYLDESFGGSLRNCKSAIATTEDLQRWGCFEQGGFDLGAAARIAAIASLVVVWWAIASVPGLLREMRRPSPGLPLAPPIALAVAAFGAVLATAIGTTGGMADITLAAEVGAPILGTIALAHLAIAFRLHRAGGTDLAGVALAAAAALAAIATLFITDGPGYILALAVGAAILGLVTTRTRAIPTLVAALVLAAIAALRSLDMLPPWDVAPTTRESVEGILAVVIVSALTVWFAWITRDEHGWRRAARLTAGAALLYTASFALVAPVARTFLDRTDQTANQSAQQIALAISVSWALIGLLLIIVAVRRGNATLRYAGIGLLAVTVAKVVLLDTNTLDAGLRVAVFLVSGIVLLIGGYALTRLDGHARAGHHDIAPPV
jgi:uncharacterized membrane protein